jgi:hypothetical protein
MNGPGPADQSQDCAPAHDPRTVCAETLAPVREVFRAVCLIVVPEAERLDAAGWRELESGVDQALALQPLARRRQLRLLIRAVDWLPVLRWGRRFRRLDPGRRQRVLAALQDAPLLLLRRGFWGLRTLVLLGYYTRPGAAAEIGYRATTQGWEARP